MNLANALLEEGTHTYTENGMKAKNTTGDCCLDFFSTIGSLRFADKERIIQLFTKAYAENPEVAIKTFFYGRDIRGGLGERKAFRSILTFLGDNYPDIVRKNMHLIPEYGRWDDLYVLIGTEVEEDMWKCMKAQLRIDMIAYLENKSISNLAKWIRHPHTRGKRSKQLGILTAKHLGIPRKKFSATITKLRRYSNVIETTISDNGYGHIKYSAVPSRAMTRYRKLFETKDTERFKKYLEDLSSGTATIHSDTLYPYDIVKKYLTEGHTKADNVLEEQWKALPDYFNGKSYNVLSVVDVSDSMTWNQMIPISTAIGLGIYLAERCEGPFHDMFLTFSSRPSVEQLKGNSLLEKIYNMKQSDWGGFTDINYALQTILRIAKNYNVQVEEMPKALLIISDMEFNNAYYNSWSFYDDITEMFEAEGYVVPTIIFWNVDSRHDVFHTDKDRKGVILVGGHSASTFQTVFSCLDTTPIDLMLQTVLSKRYEPVQI